MTLSAPGEDVLSRRITFNRRFAMSLRPGDRVTLSLNPVIYFAKYESLKPFASISREMGDDPEADFADLQAEVRRLLMIAVTEEITHRSRLYDVLGEDNNLNDLLAFCEEEIDSGTQRPSKKIDTEGKGKKAKPKKSAKKGGKAPRKKEG